MDSWLVTITQLPTEDPAARMRVLRTLESLGAAVMREGAYLLPDTTTNRQALEALADYVGKSAGTAQVLQVSATAPAQYAQLKRLFDRSARYEDLGSGALGFAFDGAHFAAGGARVAYEEMLAQLKLGDNPALAKIGSIVHFLEMGGSAVPEAAGVQMLLQGAQRRSTNVPEFLAEAEKTFDLLYEAYYEPARKQ